MTRENIIEFLKTKNAIYNKSLITDDYKRILSIKRMVRHFETYGKINYNLIFNNIIILTNKYEAKDIHLIFSNVLSDSHLKIINPFFVFMGLLETLEMNEYVIEILKTFADENNISADLLRE